jgi:hypothetical protein
MQLNQIDWYILNAFVFHNFACLMEDFKSGKSLGRFNWAYLFAGGKFMKTILYKSVFYCVKLIARWILVPVVVALLYFYFHREEVAIWVAIPYAIYILIHIILSPKRLLEERSQRKKEDEIGKKIQRLEQIYYCVKATTFNPTRLREQIISAENEGVILKPVVYSILDRAIQRDPAVFTFGE